eukprot:TRINITY_DN38135_c0_g1_i1.p1 TRINITY_DN38135_c0_g1~~TRINITY_DN38135_c0_g1_i1.p1  ORF type:complete len:242 (+),score=22.53 TRINITY_DN38135_c0_g1_i1:49-726(+)
MLTALLVFFALLDSCTALIEPAMYINTRRVHGKAANGAAKISLQKGAELVDIPAVMSGGYFFPIEEVDMGDDIMLYCMGSLNKSDCVFFVNVYHCPRCSSPVNGDLPGSLTLAGYSGGSCSPGYKHPQTGDSVHPMVTFSVPVSFGKSVTLPSHATDLSFFSVFAVVTTSCQKRTLSACEEAFICTVSNKKCLPSTRICPAGYSNNRNHLSGSSCTNQCLAGLLS